MLKGRDGTSLLGRSSRTGDAAEAAGLAPAEIERTLGISRRTLRRWHQRLAVGDSLEPGQSPGRPRSIGRHQEAALRDQVAAHPDATLAEHCTLWQQAQGVAVSRATMCRALGRLDWSLKKTVIAHEQDPVERTTFQTTIAQLDPTQVVVLDETSTPTNLTPRRARAPRGQRVSGRVPRRRWATVTLLATMTRDGMGEAVQFPGALDRDVFAIFIAEWLVPTLHPGRIISWDNVSVHRSPRAQRAIEAAGCQILATPAIPLIAIRSNRPSARSKRRCGARRPAPSTPSSPPPVTPSPRFPPPMPAASSPLLATP